MYFPEWWEQNSWTGTLPSTSLSDTQQSQLRTKAQLSLQAEGIVSEGQKSSWLDYLKSLGWSFYLPHEIRKSKHSLANLHPRPTEAQVKFLWKHARCSVLVDWFRLSEELVQRQPEVAERRTRANKVVSPEAKFWKAVKLQRYSLGGKNTKNYFVGFAPCSLKKKNKHPRIWGNWFTFHNASIRLPKLSARARLWGRAWVSLTVPELPQTELTGLSQVCVNMCELNRHWKIRGRCHSNS